MSFDRSAFAGTFVQEAREYLEKLNQGMVELEKNPADAELLTELLRAAHTLKGSSRMLKFRDINQVAHTMEDVLEGIRDGQLVMSPEVGDVFFLALDQISHCVELIAGGGEGDEDVSGTCRSLDELRPGGQDLSPPPPKAPTAEPAPDAPVVETPPGAPKPEPQEVARPPEVSAFVDTFVQEAREHLETLNQGLVELEKSADNKELMTEVLRSAHTLKGSSRMLKFMDINQVAHSMEDVLEEIRDGQLAMSPEVGDVFFLALDEIGACVEGIASSGAGNRDVSATCASLASLRSGPGATPEPDADTGAAVPAAPAAGPAPVQSIAPETPRSEAARPATPPPETTGKPADGPVKGKPATGPEETLRIGTSGLDAAIRLAGEIRVTNMRLDHDFQGLAEVRRVLRRHQVRAERYLDGEVPETGDLEELCQETKHLCAQIDDLYRRYRDDQAGLERMVTELQGKTLDMRMLPLSTIFDSLPRAVRDLSRELGKEVELVVEGADTRMDKKLIERLDGPMVHMVRNCLDHGIEAPDERERTGKPAKGTLRIAASQEGDHIAIIVEDDGKGIDLDAVREKVLLKGLIEKEDLDEASEQDIANLIFLPGFSTAPIITDLSGRGVGMDVVRSTVEELKGVVSVATQQGAGSRLTLQLPMTLTTIRAMLVECAGLTFAIPIGHIAEAVKIERRDIIQVVGREAISHKNQMIPVASLTDVLGLKSADREDREEDDAIIVRSGGEHIALVIDAIIDEHDILLKPLPRHMGTSPCVSGVSVFGDSQISVVLYVPGVVESMRSMAGTQQIKAPTSEEGAGKTILVVDDSLNTREIEKSILEAHGYEVELARDGREGLTMAQSKGYDMIVTDLDMPRMDGFALVERLRQDTELSHIPIIIVTSREKPEDRERGIEVGADAYIPKGGFDQSTLVDTVESLIG